MVRDIEPAESEDVFVVRPLALHHLHVEPFLLEKSVFDRAEDRRLASDADVTDSNFVRSRGRIGIVTTASGQQERHYRDERA